VVLAMNAWAIRFREIRRKVLVVGSDIVATAPIPERLEESGWRDGLAISDSRLLVHYYRTTNDGRIVFGKGGGELALGRSLGRRFEGASPRRAQVEAALRSTYPFLADVPIVRSWTGPIDRSRTGLPFFGRLRHHSQVVYGVGYSGNGVGPAHVGGRILASLALGLDDEWAACPLVGPPEHGFPPEPFRYVGGHVVRAAIERKERAEDEGRRVGPLTKALVRLAPAGLVPIRRG
jgi:glycine/D-amino acid oxidase-like deaminating enzyme